jgi:hypothetical protein
MDYALYIRVKRANQRNRAGGNGQPVEGKTMNAKTTHKTISNSAIRTYILRREGAQKVKITRSGEIHCYGSMPRGDGGKKCWWMFVGQRDQIEMEMTENCN